MASTDGTETQNRCSRCRRPLRVSKGIGPRCAAIEAATAGLKPEQAAKALEVIADHGVIATGHKGVYRVTATSGTETYLTALTGHCSCPWGCRRHSALAKTCYHVAAARLTAKPLIRAAA